MSTEMKDILERLQQALIKSGFSMLEVSKRTDIPYSALQRYFTGETEKIPIDRIEKISRCLNVETSYIMGWLDQKNVQQPSDYLGGNITDSIAESLDEIPTCGITLPILGWGSCGAGILNESPIDYIEIPLNVLGKYKDTQNFFFAYASGISMERAGIKNGSLLLFRKQEELYNGEIGIFHLNGEEFCKRFKKEGTSVLLLSDAFELGHDPIVVTDKDDFRIIAKLFKCIIDF